MINDADEYLHHRLCSLGDDRCGMTSTGFCAGVVDAPSACDDDAGADGAFGSCHTSDLSRNGVPASPSIDEVITVYLQP
jgi:hypothetical protein